MLAHAKSVHSHLPSAACLFVLVGFELLGDRACFCKHNGLTLYLGFKNKRWDFDIITVCRYLGLLLKLPKPTVKLEFCQQLTYKSYLKSWCCLTNSSHTPRITGLLWSSRTPWKWLCSTRKESKAWQGLFDQKELLVATWFLCTLACGSLLHHKRCVVRTCLGARNF